MLLAMIRNVHAIRTLKYLPVLVPPVPPILKWQQVAIWPVMIPYVLAKKTFIPMEMAPVLPVVVEQS